MWFERAKGRVVGRYVVADERKLVESDANIRNLKASRCHKPSRTVRGTHKFTSEMQTFV